jgi:hypothetical protein
MKMKPFASRATNTCAEDALAKAIDKNPIEGWDLTREHHFHPERECGFDIASRA